MTAARIKTAELAGAMLDYYVYLAECNQPASRPNARHMYAWQYQNDERRDYSTNWMHGGPIIEREGLCIEQFKGRKHSWQAFEFNSGHTYRGPTPLVAAMRAYVASKFGDEVEAIEGGR